VAWLGELDAAGRLSVKAAATWNFTYQKGLFEEEVRSEWVELTEGCYLWEPEYHKRAYMQLFGIFTTPGWHRHSLCAAAGSHKSKYPARENQSAHWVFL
jgi:hypothetical protein